MVEGLIYFGRTLVSPPLYYVLISLSETSPNNLVPTYKFARISALAEK